MSTIVATKALRVHDLFEMASGSVYETVSHGSDKGPVQARLWCAHPPDSSTSAPPLIDLPPEQQVRLLSRDETRVHSGHAGYVRARYEQDMDRQHQERMRVVYEQINREDTARWQRQRARLPWWKTLFR